MKKYLLPLLFSFSAAFNSAKAQSFATDSIYVTGITTDTLSNNEIDAYIYFHNNGSRAVSIVWSLINDTTPSAWQFGICDNDQCYYNYNGSLVGATHLSDSISVGDSMSLEARFSPYCDSGLGTLKVSAKVFGTFVYDTLTFVANINTQCVTTGIANLNSGITPVQLFPNPSSGSITVQGLPVNNHALHIDILDMEGQVLQSTSKTNNSQLILSCGNLPEGMYLLRITDLQDGTVSTGKFSKLGS